MDSAQKSKPEEAHVRLLLSCDRCRQRKVKCDGIKPSCSRCAKSEAGCHYSPIVEKRRSRKTGNYIGIDQLGSNSSLSEVLDIHQEINDLMGRLREISIQTVTSDFIPSSRAESIASTSDLPRSQTCYSERNRKESMVSSGGPSTEFTSIRIPFSKDTSRLIVSNFFEYNCSLFTGFDDHSKVERYLLQSVNSSTPNPLLMSVLAAGSLVTKAGVNSSDSVFESSKDENHFKAVYPLLNNLAPQIFGINSLENLSTLNNCALVSLKTGENLYYSSMAVRMGFCLGLQNPNSELYKQSSGLFWSAIVVDSLLSLINGQLPAASYDELDNNTQSDIGKLAIILIKAAKKSYSASSLGTGQLASNSQFSAHLLMELDMWYGANSENVLFDFLDLEKTEVIDSVERNRDIAKRTFLHCLYHFLVIVVIQNFSSDIWTLSKNNVPEAEIFVNERSIVSARLMSEMLDKANSLDVNYLPPCLSTFVYVGSVVYTEPSSLINADSNDHSLNYKLFSKNVEFLNKMNESRLTQNLLTRCSKLQQKIHQQNEMQSAFSGLVNGFPNTALLDFDTSMLAASSSIGFGDDVASVNQFPGTLPNFDSQKMLSNSVFSDTSSSTAFGSRSVATSNINDPSNIFSGHPNGFSANIDDIISNAFSSS
ncbi:Protein SIP4 [Smittium mucronatum]|uniref:Protein SIP4 n=1 Tax=Smittium mucronatum TaxID=133383 RepID=A0A1R0GVE0_9FUNG|nr:Protein SIP4 [Smittium mucronatum]